MTLSSNTTPLCFELVDVTPAMAQEWLNTMIPDNRRVSRLIVERYALAMTRDEWNALTGDTIGFDASGALLNGQHRLLAVIMAGKAVRMLICKGIPREAFHLIDQGRPRSALWYMPEKHRATIKAMFGFTDGQYLSSPVTTQGLLEEKLEEHRDAVLFACDAFPLNQRGIATAVTRAIVARATYHTDAPLLVEFADCLYAKRTASTANRQLTCQRFLKYRLDTQEMTDNRSVIYRKTEYAVAGFIGDKPITSIRDPRHELFPLPGEQGR